MECPSELNAKIHRVNNMASDLHQIKKQFRENLIMKHSNSKLLKQKYDESMSFLRSSQLISPVDSALDEEEAKKQ